MCRVQIGGGIKKIELLEKCVNAGAEASVIGTKAVEDPNFVKDLCSEFHKKIIIGIDAKNGEMLLKGLEAYANSKVNAISLSKRVRRFRGFGRLFMD